MQREINSAGEELQISIPPAIRKDMKSGKNVPVGVQKLTVVLFPSSIPKTNTINAASSVNDRFK